MPLSVAGLVILVSALASGITFALVNNSNNAKASNSTIVTTTPVLTTVITSSPIETTTIVPTTDPYAGWKDYKNETLGITLKLPAKLYIEGETAAISNNTVTNDKSSETCKINNDQFYSDCKISGVVSRQSVLIPYASFRGDSGPGGVTIIEDPASFYVSSMFGNLGLDYGYRSWDNLSQKAEKSPCKLEFHKESDVKILRNTYSVQYYKNLEACKEVYASITNNVNTTNNQIHTSTNSN